jgi:hypothetical protein
MNWGYFMFLSMRILPQDQDTGGFFIAVLRKKTKMELTSSIKEQELHLVSKPIMKRKKGFNNLSQEEPYVFLSSDSVYLQSIK